MAKTRQPHPLHNKKNTPRSETYLHRFQSEYTLQDIEIRAICPDLDVQVGS